VGSWDQESRGTAEMDEERIKGSKDQRIRGSKGMRIGKGEDQRD
jgi:hypothetical protein